MGTKIYKVYLRCKNCEISRTMKIKQGVPVKDFIKENKCKYCGCKTLEN